MILVPFDLIGWSEAAPGTGTVGITAPATEKYYTISGDSIKAKSRAAWLLGLLYAAESTPSNAKLAQPSLVNDYQFVRAMDLNDADPALGFSDHRGRPLALMPDEFITTYSVNGTDEDTIIGALLGSGRITTAMIEQVTPTHKIRGSADQTLTANAWTGVSMTWDQTLPKGRYAIVGMLYGAYIASGYMTALARLNIPESIWKPGVPIHQAEGDKVSLMSVVQCPWEKWPVYKEFEIEHDNMPTFEVLSPAALTDHAVELELVKVS